MMAMLPYHGISLAYKHLITGYDAADRALHEASSVTATLGIYLRNQHTKYYRPKGLNPSFGQLD